MIAGYQQLWKAIIRPPRSKYSQQDLGPIIFKHQGLKIQRTQIQLINKRGYKLKCSHYQPFIRPCKQLPCVIYLHGNSSCQIQGRSCIPHILCHDVTLFTFDFSGCGNSEGEYISLGYYERDDVQVVFQYLRSLKTVSSIGFWGRSMGAVTALMYADRNPQIGCLVLDSPFSNLKQLCKQLAERFTNGFISFLSSPVLYFIAKTIKQKNNFDIQDLDPLGNHVTKTYIPAFFIAAQDDDFVLPKHTKKLFQNYQGQKKLKIVKGDHNSQRDSLTNEAISIFFYNNLHVRQLIKNDLQFIKEQQYQKYRIKQRKKIKKSKEQDQQQNSKIKKIYNNVFDCEYNQKQMLEIAIKLSLQKNINNNFQINIMNNEQRQIVNNNLYLPKVPKDGKISLKSQKKIVIQQENLYNKYQKTNNFQKQKQQYSQIQQLQNKNKGKLKLNTQPQYNSKGSSYLEINQQNDKIQQIEKINQQNQKF